MSSSEDLVNTSVTAKPISANSLERSGKSEIQCSISTSLGHWSPNIGNTGSNPIQGVQEI